MKVAVYIGRFQPFHYGHKAIIDHVHTLGYDDILVLVGCTEQHVPTDRNPMSGWQVLGNIVNNFKVNSVRTLYDVPGDNLDWVTNLDSRLTDFSPDAEFHLITHNKPSEDGKYGLKPGQYISDFILENSTKISKLVDLSSLQTPKIDATEIRLLTKQLMEICPAASITNLIYAYKDSNGQH